MTYTLLTRCSINNKPLRLMVYSLRRDASTSTTSTDKIDHGFVEGPNPFKREKEQCIICKHKIVFDYKNPRLLSQFVSPLTGEIYQKNITNLCLKQQSLLRNEVRKSIKAMLMPKFYRDPKFNRDPALFNPERPRGKFP